jgi:hypothetical protein
MQIFRLKSQRILLLFLLLGTLLVPASIITNNASAQEAIQWYPAKRIPNYDDQYNPPILVADQNQTIHAFNSEPINETENAIFYRKFTRDQGWGIPVSIIYPVNRQANIVQGAFLDPLGSIHLVYYHGVVPDAAIYYARSPLSAAGKVAEWSQPEALGRDAGPVVAASIIGDKDGKLVMVYFGQGEGPGLYQVHSENEGETWSEPQLIYEVIKPNISPINIQTDIDANGNVHVVWAKY